MLAISPVVSDMYFYDWPVQIGIQKDCHIEFGYFS